LIVVIDEIESQDRPINGECGNYQNQANYENSVGFPSRSGNEGGRFRWMIHADRAQTRRT
jgi:glutaminase